MKQNKLQAKTPLKAKTSLKATKPMAAKPKKHTLAWWKKETRTHFNRAIKYRDSEYKNGSWVFPCITCDKPTLFKDDEGRFYRTAHAGHFQPETRGNTRFNETNVNGQCGICNFNQGEQFKYAKALDLKYGDGTAEALEREAKETKVWTIPELQEIIADSKAEIDFYERQEHG